MATEAPSRRSGEHPTRDPAEAAPNALARSKAFLDPSTGPSLTRPKGCVALFVLDNLGSSLSVVSTDADLPIVIAELMLPVGSQQLLMARPGQLAAVPRVSPFLVGRRNT